MPTRRQSARQPARTNLEQRIRERQQTFEEFAEYAEKFARDHGEPGTLSVRHLQRLVAGRRPDGGPLAPPRPATARLLEAIFGVRVSDLLSSPAGLSPHSMVSLERPNTPHILRVAIAVVLSNSEILLVRRRELNDTRISWQFPAGMIKPEYSPESVAVGETFSETGVHCVVRSNLGGRLHPVTNVYCEYFLCEYVTGSAMNMDAVENVGVTWAEKMSLDRFIPIDQIFTPVLDALNIATMGSDRAN